MISIPIPQEQRLRLSCIPWETYVSYSDGLGPRHIRVTYDQGEMEVMTLSSKHEKAKKILARLVETMTDELEIEIAGFGSMTCRCEDMQRGLEPDESYWIAHELEVRGRDDIDLESDPPPDLALEMEISRSTLDRLAIYAALKVPEIWCWDRVSLRVYLLTAKGTYRLSKRSKAFPFLPLEEFSAFLTRSDLSQTKLIREFRAWVRENRDKWLSGG